MTIWSMIGWTMLHFLWVGAILGALACVGRRLLRFATPELQYAYGLICLAMLALSPFIIVARLLPAPSESGPAMDSPPATISRPLHVPATIPSMPVTPTQPVAVSSRIRALETLAERLPYLWLMGAPLTFAYLALGLAGAERLRRQSRPVDDPRIRDLARQLAGSLGMARRVAVATCDRLAAPVLVGIVRPTILLPARAITGWTADQLEMALLHELVHVRRWDNLLILLQRLVESLLFFHPAVWVVSGWVHRDRELCCDGAVVRHTGRPVDYAEMLLSLTDPRPSRGSAVVAMAEGNLVARVRRLLQPGDPSMKLPRTTLALAAGLLLAPALLIAARPDDPPANAQDADGDAEIRRIAAEALEAIHASAGPLGSWTLTDVAMSQAKFGDREGAVETLRQAVPIAAAAKQQVTRTGGMIGYGLSSARQLWRVAHHQAELGEKQDALETLRLALRAKDEEEPEAQRLETLALIAQELTGLGARDEAMEVAKRADRESEALEKLVQGYVGLPPVAAAHAGAGDIDGAFDLLDRIAGSGRDDLEKQWVIGHALGEIAKAVESADRATARAALDRVLRRLDDVTMAENKPLIDIAWALARIGDFEGGMRAARLVGEGPTRVDYDMRDGKPYAMLLVALEQRKAGDLEGARQNLREAYETTKSIDESRGKSGRLEQVASGMIGVGDLEGARRCVEDMKPGSRYETLAEIARAQTRAGDREGGMGTFRQALDDASSRRDHPARPEMELVKSDRRKEPDVDRWNAQVDRDVATIQAMMGDVEAARKTAESIGDERWRAIALYEVAQAQAAAGDAAGALAWARALNLPPTRQSPLAGIIEGVSDYLAAKEEKQAGAGANPEK